MRRILAAPLLAGTTLGLAEHASAADHLATASSAVEIACSGVESQTPISQQALAEAVLSSAGVLPSRLSTLVATEPGRPEGYRPSASDLSEGALLLVRDPARLGEPMASKVDILVSVLSNHAIAFDGQLARKLVVVGAVGDGSVFDDGVSLVCPGKTPRTQIADAPPVRDERRAGAKAGEHRLVVRAKVDDFVLAAKDASGSAQGSYARERKTDLDGDSTTTSTLAIRGAAGVLIAGDTIDSYLFGYGDYALNRVRTETSPTPTPSEEDGRSKDIDALEAGLSGSVPVFFADHGVRLTGRAGAIFDFEKSARRLIGTVRVEPIAIGSIGPARAALCNVGAYSDNILGLPAEARCSGAFRADVSEILRAGSAELTDADELVALGGEVLWEFRPPLLGDGKPADGLVGSLGYRYQRMVAGNAPDIDRFDASLKYRWWAGDLAFDLGFTFSDGTEPKSLVDENKFSVSVGVLY